MFTTRSHWLRFALSTPLIREVTWFLVRPNRHAMLHSKSPPLGIDELTAIYEKQKSG